MPLEDLEDYESAFGKDATAEESDGMIVGQEEASMLSQKEGTEQGVLMNGNVDGIE